MAATGGQQLPHHVIGDDAAILNIGYLNAILTP